MSEASSSPTPRRVRVRTAKNDRQKALQQYQDLRRSKTVVKALVIAEIAGGDVEILGQGLGPSEIAQLLVIGAEALLAIEAGSRKAVAHRPHIEPKVRGEHNGMTARRKEITLDADGVLVPPKGENVISCEECGHPEWFVLFFNTSEQPSRYACCHCGNEVKSIPAHAGGNA